MFTRDDLKPLIIRALKSGGGTGRVIQVCKFIWDNYEAEIKASGDLLYKWQYDVRWAAQELRDEGLLKPVHGSRSKPWELA